MQNALKSAIELIKDDPLRIGVMRIVGNIADLKCYKSFGCGLCFIGSFIHYDIYL
jgi:hypothetical protein